MSSYKTIIVVLILIIAAGVGFFAYYYFNLKSEISSEKIWKIGLLAIADKQGVQDENFEGFKSAMLGLGYVEGENLSYTIKSGDSRKEGDLEKTAKELNEMGLDIIMTSSTSATKALKNLSDLKTPVFFLAAGRPADLVKNLSSPEGLITGMGEPTAEFAGKRLEFLKEIVPSLDTVGFLLDKGHATGLVAKKSIDEAAKVLGISVRVFEVISLDEVVKTLPLISKKNGIDAYIACSCPSNTRFLKEMAEHFRKNRIPSVSDEVEGGARIGWLVTYSNDRRKAGERAAERVDKILKGVPVSQVPVEFARDIILEINLKTANDIGVTIPDHLLRRANKVYNE